MTAKQLSSEELLERARALLRPRFEPLRLIGRGGMGFVVAAKHLTLDREVAIKLLPDGQSTDPVVRARFLREARAAANLRHPNLVTLHDVDETNGYIVMELIEGETLRQRMKRRGRLSPNEVRKLGAQLLDALATAHDAGIVHRDVKPSNILFDPAGEVKLTDFGVAYVGDTGLTTPGLYVGTPAYMAPEQLRGRVVDGRADVYSAGATLFEALTGQKLHDDDRDITEVASFIFERTGDRSIADAIQRAVAERPELRFDDARAFAAALLDDGHDDRAWNHDAATPLVPAAPTNRDPTDHSIAGGAPTTVNIGSARGVRWLYAGVALALLLAGADLGYRWARQHGWFAQEGERKVAIALLPFADKSGHASLDFARAGLPFLLGSELQRAPDVTVIGYYKLHASIPNNGAPQAEWMATARRLGADLMLQGELTPIADRFRVTLVLSKKDGSEIARWVADGPLEDVPRNVQNLAGEIASAALGSPVALERRVEDFTFQRFFLSGVAALESHKIGEAYDLLQRAVGANGTSAQAYYYLAIASWWHNHPSNLTQGYLERALRLGPTAAERAFLEGLSLLVERRYKESIEHFRRSAKLFPEQRDILYGLSEALFHGGYPREGVEVYQHTLTLYPNFRLGMMHALTFALDHGDEQIFDWAVALEPVSGYENIWEARANIAFRRYDVAIEMLLRIAESAAQTEPDLAGLAQQELANAYVATGQIELARAFAEKWPLDVVAAHLPLFALALARCDGARTKDQRDALLRLVASFEPGSVSSDQIALVAQAEIPEGDREVLQALLTRILAVTPAELNRDPRYRVTLRLLRDRIDGSGTPSGAEDEATTPEIDAIDRAIAAKKAHRSNEAGQAYVEATRWSSDGRFSLLLHFLAAEQFRAGSAHQRVIDECLEVVAPRVIHWEWGGAIGPCLAYTVEAEAALGHRVQAEAAAQRLYKLRSSAPADDRVIAIARRALK